MSQAVLPQQIQQWLYKVLQAEYLDQRTTYREVSSVLLKYPTLRPRTRVYTSETGDSKLLLCLYGSIPCTIQSRVYKIPIELWVPHEYPIVAPFCYVVPTEKMVLNPGNHVDNSGKCYLPYLSSWNQNPGEGRSTLLGLCQELSRIFAIQCPVYAKPATTSVSSTPTSQLQRPQPENAYQHSSSSVQLQPQLTPQSAPYQSYSQPQSHSQSPVPALPPKPNGHPSTLSPPPLPPLPQDLRQKHLISPTLQQINVRSQQQTASIKEKITKQIEQPDFMDKTTSVTEDLQRKKVLREISALLQKLHEVDVAQDINTFSNGIDQIQYAIEKFDKIFEYEFRTVDSVKSQISENEQILKSTIRNAESTISEAHAHAELNPDEAIIAETVVHNQLYELVSEDLAISDTISALTKAYELGRISLQSFIKNTRSLSREQFTRRALINKISALLKLE